jgi:hypothetical protein
MSITIQKKTFKGELVISFIAMDNLVPHLNPLYAARIEKMTRNAGTIYFIAPNKRFPISKT